MEKMSSLLDQVLIQGAAELDVSNDLVLLVVKLLVPSRLVSMHGIIELLKDAEVSAQRRFY